MQLPGGFSTYAAVVPGSDLTAAAPTAVPVQDATEFTAAAFPTRQCQEQGVFHHANFRPLAKRCWPPCSYMKEGNAKSRAC